MAFRLHVVVESISDDYNFKLSSRISPLNLNTMLFIPSKYHYAYVKYDVFCDNLYFWSNVFH